MLPGMKSGGSPGNCIIAAGISVVLEVDFDVAVVFDLLLLVERFLWRDGLLVLG